MLQALTYWLRGRLAGASRRRRRAARSGHVRLALELLEHRVMLDARGYTLGLTPTPIEVGHLLAGQTVRFLVNFNTADGSDEEDNELVTIQGSAGSQVTVRHGQNQIVAFPIAVDGETVTATMHGDSPLSIGGPDESATLTVSPSLDIRINDTADPSDNVTLYNAPSQPLPCTQEIDARLTNLDDATVTYTLAVEGANPHAGNATLKGERLVPDPVTGAPTVTLAAGQFTEITIRPTADSSSANDVHIVARAGGNVVGRDTLTVISVALPKDIRNADTPVEMKADRIPPRVDTPIPILVMPANLGPDSPITVSLPSGVDSTPGVVIFNPPDLPHAGRQYHTLVGGSQTVNLAGVLQTLSGHAGQLKVMLQVRGQETIVSNGFSVAAIPLNFSDSPDPGVLVQEHIDPRTDPGLGVDDRWQSDSGDISDLDAVAIRELVQFQGEPTGVFEDVSPSQHSSYMLADAFTGDTHTYPVTGILEAMRELGKKFGRMVTGQISEFLDERTRSYNIPVANSGFTIIRTVERINNALYLTVRKEGHEILIRGDGVLPKHDMSSAAAATTPADGIDTGRLFVANLAPSDPLEVTAQPPVTVPAGQPFGLVVTAKNSDGSVNTAFHDLVTIRDYAGRPIDGMLTVNAVQGVATFSGLRLYQASYYRLDVSTPTLPTVASNFFNVNAAPATRLVLSNITSGDSFVSAGDRFPATVIAVDPWGNQDLSFNAQVTVAIANNAGGAVLGGTIRAMPSGGIALLDWLTLTRPGTGYTLRAASGGLSAAVSQPFNVHDRLVVTGQPPNPVRAGSPFDLIVRAEDGLGNVDTSWHGTVTLRNGLINSSSTYAATVTAIAVNGAARFAGLTFPVAGSYGPEFDSSGFIPVNLPHAITVIAARATRLALTVPPGPIAPGSSFSVSVNAADPYGNVDPSWAGTITVGLAHGPGGATLGGTTALPASSGAAIFALTLDKPGDNYILQAAAASLATGGSAPFAMTDQLVLTTVPHNVTFNAPFEVVVEAHDGLGNVDTAMNGPVTVVMTRGTYFDDRLSGTRTVNLVNGIGHFSDLSIAQAGSIALFFDGDGLTETSVQLDVTGSSSATHLRFAVNYPAVFYDNPGGVPTALTGLPFSLVVEAVDDFGRIDPKFIDTVTIALENNPTGATLGGTTTTSHTYSQGVFKFDGLTLDRPGAGYTFRATVHGLADAISPALNVSDDTLSVSGPAFAVTAGAVFKVHAAALVQGATVDTAFHGNVTVSIQSGPAGGILIGATALAAIAGAVDSSDLHVNVAGSYVLAVTATSPAGVPIPQFSQAATVHVDPVPAMQLIAAGPADPVAAGAPFSLTVTAEDGFGNVDYNFAGSVTLTLTGGARGAVLGGTLSAMPISGVAYFTGLTISKPGAGYTITAASGHLFAGTAALDTTPDQLLVTAAPQLAVAAGSPFGLTVSAMNSTGQVDTSYSGTVSLAVTGSTRSFTNLGGTVALRAIKGVATFTGLTLDRADIVPLTAAGAGAAPVTTDVTVAASRLVVAGPPPALLTAGAPFTLALAAEDAQGNVDSRFNGRVTLRLATNPGSTTLAGPLVINAVQGIATFRGLAIGTVGAGYTLAASADGMTDATTGAVTVTAAGTATHLVIATPPPSSLAAGQGFGLVVQAADSLGSVDSGYAGPVTVTLNDYTQTALDSRLSGTLTVNADHGVATFAGLTSNRPGLFGLSVTATGLPPAMTALVNVAADAATHFAIALPSAAVLTNAPLGLSVSAVDASGNVDAGFQGSVTLALGSNAGGATLGGTLTASVVNGSAVFAGLTLDRPGASFTLTATGAGLSAGTSDPFDVTNDRLVVTTPVPAVVAAGTAFGLVVQAVDGQGNLDTAYHGLVQLANLFGADPQGTLLVRASGGIATFAGLSIAQSGYDTLAVTAAGAAGVTSDIFQVTALPATQLTLAAPDGPVLTMAPFQVTARAVDGHGNIDPAYQGLVTLKLGDNAAGATLGGTLTGTAIAGIATFTGLTLDRAGTGFRLAIAAKGLQGATSPAFDVAADRLVVTTPVPGSVGAGVGFGLVVSARDGLGNIDTAFNATVTVTNPADSSQVGQTGADHGVATFAGMTLSQAGTYVLNVNGGGLATQANPFNVTAAPATRLVSAVANGRVLVGAPFAAEVLAVNPLGDVDPVYHGSVTIALAANPANGTLGGTLTATAMDGIASFTGLTLDQLGTAYTITASSSDLTAGTSFPFDVVNRTLAVSSQPPASLATGAPFGLTVTATDRTGMPDASFIGNVTVAASDSHGAPATLGGTLTMPAVMGVATFTGLTLNQAGIFTLLVTSSGAGATVTNNMQVTPSTPLSFVSPGSVTFQLGQDTPFLLATLSVPAAALHVNGTLPPGLTLTDNHDGTATLAGTPTVAGSYRVNLVADNGVDPARTQPLTLLVQDPPRVTSLGSDTFAVGQARTFTFQTGPGAAGPITLKVTGTLPAGVRFIDRHDGTALLTGTPRPGSGNAYPLTITAADHAAQSTQSFTLIVNEPVTVLTKPTIVTFVPGQPASFTVATIGYPRPSFNLDQVPDGLSLTDHHDGTVTLGGILRQTHSGLFSETLTIDNGIGPDVAWVFALGVARAPTIYTLPSATFTVGTLREIHVLTVGYPYPSFTVTGTLPAGVTYDSKGYGVLVLHGTALPGTGGIYALKITAANSQGSDTEGYALTVNEAPSLTVPASLTLIAGQSAAVTATTAGFPLPGLSFTGLPDGLDVYGRGTPTLAAVGPHTVTVTASNGSGPDVVRIVAVLVRPPALHPAFATDTFAVGQYHTFTLPAPSDLATPVVLTVRGGLPPGVRFVDNHNGTATFKGTPTAGSGGVYTLAITGTLRGEAITAPFTLIVEQPSGLTGPRTASLTVGQAGSFDVTATGFPSPTIGATGLPAGLSLVDHHDGSATIGGTPDRDTARVYAVVLTAHNGLGADATLTVQLSVIARHAGTAVRSLKGTPALRATFTLTALDLLGMPPDPPSAPPS